MITIVELKERLAAQFDELTILDMLEVDSKMLVDAFTELVEENYDKLVAEVLIGEDDAEVQDE
jgi:hypothetical protein